MELLPNSSKKMPLPREFFANFTSHHTRKSYLIDIEQFFDYLKNDSTPKTNISKVSRLDIIEYRNWLDSAGGRGGYPAAPKTIARKLSALSSYFDFLVERGVCSYNPVTSVKRPRRQVVAPTTGLEVEQVRDILTETLKNKRSGHLHNALLSMFFTTGMRKSEILKLKFKNYKQINKHKIVEYHAKGGKKGQKLLHPMCVEALENYLSFMRDNGREHRPEDWLFMPTHNPADPGNVNKSLNPKTINEIIDHYAKKVGINFKVTPHSARATFIGTLLQAGVDIYAVSQEVGHSSVKTTQEYDKRRRNLRNSPVAKLEY